MQRHLYVRVFPDHRRAVLALLVYGVIGMPVWLVPMPDPSRWLLAVFIVIPAVVEVLSAMQWTGSWSIHEVVLTSGGRWVLMDKRMHRENAVLVQTMETSPGNLRLQFRDRHHRSRIVDLNQYTCNKVRLQRLAFRLHYGIRPARHWGIESAN